MIRYLHATNTYIKRCFARWIRYLPIIILGSGALYILSAKLGVLCYTNNIMMLQSIERSQDCISLAPDAHDVLQVRDECRVDDMLKPECNSDVEVAYIYKMPDISLKTCNVIISITENISASNPFDASKLDLINSQVSKYSGATVENIKEFKELRVTIDGQSYMLRMLDTLGPRDIYDYGDLVEMQFKSKYVANVPLIFSRGNTAWMVVESSGSDVCILKENGCTDEDIRLMMHDVLHGLKDIHDQACVSMRLLPDGVVTVRDTLGNVTGYKVIAIGHKTKGYGRDSFKEELLDQLWCLDKTIGLHLYDKFTSKRSDMPYHMIAGDFSIHFGEKDQAMADFMAVMCGKVEYPPVTASDLLEHHYITGKEPSPLGDIFGKRKYEIRDMRLLYGLPGSSIPDQ